jgi:Uncharacterised nucleotidyltransferase
MSYCGKNGMPRTPTPLDRLLAVLKSPELAAELAPQAGLWAEIKRLAEIHRFSGLLAHSASAWLPASERSWRDGVLMSHHRRHRNFLDQQRAFIDAFGAKGIQCVSLKGPLLAERIHAVPFLKFSHDLDILVPLADIPAATNLMNPLGFSLLGTLPWGLHRKYAHHLNFQGRGEVRMVEMHYALKAGAHLMPGDAFIERAVEWQSSDGLACRVLSPADEVFYLIVHAAGHAFHRLRWLYDALAAAKTLNAADRSSVRALAIEMGLTGYFVAADMGCREFFGEPLPLDLSGFKKPWLWTGLQTRHLRTMTQREDYTFTARSLDVCRMSGTPLSAVRLCLQSAGGKVPTLLYRVTGGPLGPDVLARTIHQTN